jgi:glycosyltransferase involved in cell wall biosynthesis
MLGTPQTSLDQRLRIASIHWGLIVGGIAKYSTLIHQVSKIAPVDIHTICILCPDWSCDEQALTELSARRIHVKSRCDLSWIFRVSSEIRQIDPHLIMTHAFNGHFVSMLMSRFFGHRAPRICSYHGLYHPPSTNRKLFAKLFNTMTEFFIRKHAARCVSVTNFSKNYLARMDVPPEKIEVIHNGIASATTVSPDARIRLRREWNITPEDIVLGAASRLDPVKGVVHLVNAFAAIAHNSPMVKLVIVGTGNQHADLERHVALLGLSDRVLFTGYRSDVDACLSAFDIFVLPSLAEYHSIALLEAMRAGKPIVATSVGGNVESVTHEREALLVAPADVTALQHAIHRLLTDKKLREDLGRAAYNRFKQKFTTETMVRKTADWMLHCANLAS